MSRPLDERLLLALAGAYVREHGIDKAEPSAPLSQYANFIWDGRRQSDTTQELYVRVDLSGPEILQLVETIRRIPFLEQELANARADRDSYLRAFAEAHEIMRSNDPTRDKHRRIVEHFGLHAVERRPKWRLRFEFEQLQRGYYDPQTETQYPPVGPVEAVNAIRQRFNFPSYEAARKALQRAGASDVPQGR